MPRLVGNDSQRPGFVVLTNSLDSGDASRGVADYQILDLTRLGFRNGFLWTHADSSMTCSVPDWLSLSPIKDLSEA